MGDEQRTELLLLATRERLRQILQDLDAEWCKRPAGQQGVRARSPCHTRKQRNFGIRRQWGRPIGPDCPVDRECNAQGCFIGKSRRNAVECLDQAEQISGRHLELLDAAKKLTGERCERTDADQGFRPLRGRKSTNAPPTGFVRQV